MDKVDKGERDKKSGLFFVVAAAFIVSGSLLGKDIFERLGFIWIGVVLFIAGILYGRGRWRHLGNFMIGVAAALSNIMCVQVTCIYFALNDKDYIGGLPRSAAFYWSIPYLFLIAGCSYAAWLCHRKARRIP